MSGLYVKLLLINLWQTVCHFRRVLGISSHFNENDARRKFPQQRFCFTSNWKRKLMINNDKIKL